MTLDEQLIHTTIRVVSTFADKSICTGTGFFFNFKIGDNTIPAIVTNKHVVENCTGISLTFNIDVNGEYVPGNKETLNIKSSDLIIISHPEKDVDLCAVLIGPILNNSGNKFYFKCFSQENILSQEYIHNSISNIEDITLIGYPDGIVDTYNNLPVVRRGITATSIKYDFDNKKEFLIDSAIFPGSSGSPVFIYNQGSYSIGNTLYAGDRMLLVGIVCAVYQHCIDGELKAVQIPSLNKIVSRSAMPNNLGLVIKAERILELIPRINALCQSTKK